MKYINADLLREKIAEQMKSLPREVGRGSGTITSKGYGMMEAFQIVRSLIDSLQQEQPKKSIEINGIRYKEVPAKTDDKICKDCDYFLDNGSCNLDVCPCACDNNILERIQQEQPIQVNTLTWRDINDLERIINNVHYEFRNGIGEKSFGEEVLERFREERDEQEQPKVDLEKEITKEWERLEKDYSPSALDKSYIIVSGLIGEKQFSRIACHFFDEGYAKGLNARKEEQKWAQS